MSGIKFFTLGHHGPYNSDVLIGQGNGCNILVSSPNETYEPWVFFQPGFSKADDSSGAVDQQGSEITISTFADAQKILLTP